MATIIFNGKTYQNPEEMPANERAAYEQVAKMLVDKNGNGIPDFLEGDMVQNVMTAFTSSVNVNGQAYNSLNELPPDVRAKVQGAFDKLAGLGIVTNSPASAAQSSSPLIGGEPISPSQPFLTGGSGSAIRDDNTSRIMPWVLGALVFVLCLAAAAAAIYFLMQQGMKLILVYTLIAGVISAVTAPIPGTSLLLTALEVYMIVHLAKENDFKLGLKEVGYAAAVLWGISTVLQDTALELLTFLPVIGWIAEVIVAVVFVFFLGILLNLYFKKPGPVRPGG